MSERDVSVTSKLQEGVEAPPYLVFDRRPYRKTGRWLVVGGPVHGTSGVFDTREEAAAEVMRQRALIRQEEDKDLECGELECYDLPHIQAEMEVDPDGEPVDSPFDKLWKRLDSRERY